MTRLVVGLVACSAAKHDTARPAGQLYRSPLFTKSARYVTGHADRWYILSALHGLLSPDDVIAPYDVRLGVNSDPVSVWARRTAGQLEQALRDVPAEVRLLVLAGATYRTVLEHLPHAWQVEIPLAGLGIGQQLSWLTRKLDTSHESRVASARGAQLSAAETTGSGP